MTLAAAVTAHDEALRYGGRDGISSLHLIESGLARPYSGYHRSMDSKAAGSWMPTRERRGSSSNS